MRISILTSSFPRFDGDTAGIFIYHFARQLARKGMEIQIISPHSYGCPCTETWNGIHINRFPYFYPARSQRLCYGAGILKNIRNHKAALLQMPFLVAAEILYASKWVRQFAPDVIHAHWSFPQGLTGILIKKRYAIPCVTTIHGSDVFSLNYPFLKNLNAKIISHSDVCTVNSTATFEMVRNLCKKSNAEIIPMGADLNFFGKTADVDVGDLRKQYGIRGKVILSVGRLIDWKGTEYLIKAIPKVLEHYPDSKALIIGSGPEKEKLLKLSKNLCLQDKVIFIEKIPQKELLKFYSLADIFVLPSVVNKKGETEGLGLVLIEAIGCGVPVIGSNVGGIPDIIKDGKTGLLVRQKDPNDIAEKVIRLLADENLQKKIIANGSAWAKKNFSWDTISDKFIEVYQMVTN